VNIGGDYGQSTITWTKAAGYPGIYGTDFVVETSSAATGPWVPITFLGGNAVITGDDVTFATSPLDVRAFGRLTVFGPGGSVASTAPLRYGLINMDYVTVGNPGNPADPTTGYGAVSYDYKIGKYEVTNAQYAEFLNAVAQTDTYFLYDSRMNDSARGGITRSGESGSYTYAVKANMGDKPVNWVSWYDSARFANWLHHSQPTGLQTTLTTEEGAYTLNGFAGLITKNSGARVWIPTENEWYKAAYYDPTPGAGGGDNFWLYPTQSDSIPTVATANPVGDVSNPGANVANYLSGADWNSQDGNATTVGSALSNNHYGTFDQGGNFWEWNDAIIGSSRGLRGASFLNDEDFLRASTRLNFGPPTNLNDNIGFRVASFALSFPSITTQPASQTITSGSTATLSVTATGAEPLTYQWYQGNSGNTTTPVGINSASFTTPALTATTSYWVRVSNTSGPAADSNTAIITVSSPATDFTWTSNGSAITITGYTGAGGEVLIPATINGLPVRRIGERAFYNNAAMTGVTIPAGVTSIGNLAFMLCHGLTSVTIPASVNSIEDQAFSDCSDLLVITVIEENPAYSSLDGVLFNKNRTTLLQYPGGKSDAYTIPVGVVIIGQNAFQSCTGLTTITIPDSVTLIQGAAFYGCTGLSSISIPASVVGIGFGAFNRCTNVLAITVSENNSAYSSVDGVMFNKERTSLIQYPVGRTGGYTIPAGVTSIDGLAFEHSAGLTSVTIPESVSIIAVNAFSYCTGLTRVTIPNGVTNIESSVFFGCTALTSAAFLGNAPTMGSSVFFNTAPGFTVYYLTGSSGFNSPTWQGYPATEIYPPTITSHPSSLTIPSGSSTTLNITATSTEPLTYQWYQGTSGDTSTPVGTNSASFTTPSLTSVTTYWVRVSNAANPAGVNSNTAIVTATGGLTVKTYDTIWGSSFLNPISNLRSATPSGTGIQTANIDYAYDTDFHLTLPGLTQEDVFCILWEGWFDISKDGPGIYTFGTSSDDGSVIYLDLNDDGDFGDSGELIVNSNFSQTTVARTGSVLLSGDSVRIAIGYFEGAGGESIVAKFKKGGNIPFASQDPINGTSGHFFTARPSADPSAANLWNFGLAGQPAVINGTNIVWTLPTWTSLESLAPTFMISDGATAVPASGTSLNFTTPQTYTITAQDGLTQSYTVTARKSIDPVLHTFDTGAQGWRVVSFGNMEAGTYSLVGNYAPSHVATGGNPGGFIRTTDLDSGINTFAAPVDFVSGLTGAIGATLSYDLTYVGIGNYFPRDVILEGGGIRLLWKSPVPLIPTAEWTRIALRFAPSTQWRVGTDAGRLATSSDFLTVLANPTGLFLAAEYTSNGADLTSIDNVSVTPSAIPVIFAQPAIIPSGTNSTLTVSLSGTEPFTYQWYQGKSGDTSTPVGTNSPSFVTPALINTTSYWVKVGNAANPGGVNSDTAKITVSIVPNPLPPYDGSPGVTNKPVKIYIMSGDAGMLSTARVSGTQAGTLNTIVNQQGMFPYLRDSGGWVTRNDVLVHAYETNGANANKQPLSPTWSGDAIGPELGFGNVMGWYHDEPVLLIRAANGNRALGWDLLPPGSPRYDWSNALTYPGYGESPDSWATGNSPSPSVWYAGKEYDAFFHDEPDMGPALGWQIGYSYTSGVYASHNGVLYQSTAAHTASLASEPGIGTDWATFWSVYSVNNTVDFLDNFATQYPQWAAQGFEIAGYVWWQGFRDSSTAAHSAKYGENMAQFIDQLRNYYANRYPSQSRPDAPFVLATYAVNGLSQTGNNLQIANEQLEVDGETGNHPVFAGNVKTIDARGFWRSSAQSPVNESSNYNRNAETFMLAGEALARGMVELLNTDRPLVATGSASAVTEKTVTLTGTVNPNGLASTALFEYGTTAEYGSSAIVTLSPGDGTGNQSVSANLTGLWSGTTYYYRLRATNSEGDSQGLNLTFTTAGTAPVFTWINDTDGLWSDPTKWENGNIPYGPGAVAYFDAIDVQGDRQVGIDSPRTVGNMTFGDTALGSAASWTLSDLGNGSNILTLAGTAPGITVNALGTGKEVTIASQIAGTSGLTKSGSGTLVLSGNNSYSGITQISGGTLKLGANERIPGNLSINGSFDLNTFSETINGLSGTGVVDSFAGGTPTLTVGGNNASSVFSGIIRNSSGTLSLAKIGSGTLTLSGVNTFNGNVTVSAGTLAVGNIAPLTNCSGITLAGGTTLRPDVVGAVISAPITLGASGTTSTINAPSIAGAGGISLVPFRLNGPIGGAGNLTFSGIQNTNAYGMIKLRAASAYTGSTLITCTGSTNTQIFVNLGIDNALPPTTVLTLDGGNGTGSGRFSVLDLEGFDQTLAGLTNVTGRTLRFQRVNNTSATASTLTINNTSDFVFSGQLGGGGTNLSLTKDGSGVFTISGSNTYIGLTTIMGGTLAIGSPTSMPATTGLVMNGGKLDLKGQNATVQSLAVGAPDVIIDFGSAVGSNTLRITNGAIAGWTGNLQIHHFDPASDQLFFGSSVTGISGNVARVSFVNPVGLAPGSYALIPGLDGAALPNSIPGGIPPSITTQPIGQAIANGSSITLIVTATGSDPLSYQWYRGQSGDTSNPVSGATSTTFDTPSIFTSRSYWIRATNTYGSADSITATVRVISSNSTLTNLTLSSGPLSPSRFNPYNLAYTASVSNVTTSVTLTPTLDDVNAVVNINGSPVVSGNPSAPIDLNVGSNVITIDVTAEDGQNTSTYTVTVNRAAPLVLATLGVEGVTSSSATLKGSVTPHDNAVVYFQYGPTTSYGSVTAGRDVNGSGLLEINTGILNLEDETDYHFRIVAENAGGTTYGDDVMFTTPVNPPVAVTGLPLAVSSTGATLAGAVNPNGSPVSVYFQYGLTTLYGKRTATQNIPAGTGLVEVNALIGDLTANAGYHYRLVALGATTNSLGNDVKFVAKPGETTGGGNPTGPPAVTTGTASAVLTDTATLKGTVNPKGGSTVFHFEYGLTPTFGSVTPSQSVGNGNAGAVVSADVSGLTPGETYYFRLVASNSMGVGEGGMVSFSTKFSVPDVETGEALGLTTSGAQITGRVRANGADAEVMVAYGTDASSLRRSVKMTPELVSGETFVPVEAQLDDLVQGATYYYQLIAENSGGTGKGTIRTFNVGRLSGLFQSFPAGVSVNEREGSITVNLTPTEAEGAWRFVGEKLWRAAGATATGLTTGDRVIEFRPRSSYLKPANETVTVISGDAPLMLDRAYQSAPGSVTGALIVTLKPTGLTATNVPVATRAQWRFFGDDDSKWRNSGFTESGLAPGNYVIQSKKVPNRAEPPLVSVRVAAGVTSSATVTYFIEEVPTGTPADALQFETVSNREDRPYAFVGQLRTDTGSGSGFVVRPGVVATAGHVVFDDGTLASATGMQWLFQRDPGVHEPVPMSPRGHYLMTGYAARRIADNSPGQSPPESQNLDAASLYFLSDAGRGGYSGFFASDSTVNEFVTSDALKTLVGYPINGIPETDQGRMHATPLADIEFSSAYGQTYITGDVRSVGGNSGGPLCVRYEDGYWYPAAIYLGGTGQTVIRAIDSAVVDLFGFAEASSGARVGSEGGSLTQSSESPSGNPELGALKVNIEPADARTAGAAWRIQALSTYVADGTRADNLDPNTYTIRFADVDGFIPPPPVPVIVKAGILTTLTFSYQAIIAPPVINSPSLVTGNRGQALAYRITATNNPSFFSIRGVLPDGMGLDSASGMISGIPDESGIFEVTVGATNAGGSATRVLNITSLPSLESKTVSAPYLTAMSASISGSESGNGAVFAASNLPQGLSLDISTGVISGIPQIPGVYTVPVSVVRKGASAAATLTLRITGTVPVITSPAAGIPECGIWQDCQVVRRRQRTPRPYLPMVFRKQRRFFESHRRCDLCHLCHPTSNKEFKLLGESE
jgi:autotransporter-associated beta strand protein